MNPMQTKRKKITHIPVLISHSTNCAPDHQGGGKFQFPGNNICLSSSWLVIIITVVTALWAPAEESALLNIISFNPYHNPHKNIIICFYRLKQNET